MAKQRSFWGIRAKLVLLVFIAIGLGSVTLAAVSVWQEATRYAQMKRDTMQSTAQILAAAATKAIVARDANGVYSVARAMGRIDNMVYVGVEDASGYHLADIGASEQLDSDLRLDEGAGNVSVFDILRSRTVEMTIPVIDAGVEVGRLKLVSDTSDLPPRIWSAITFTALGGAGALMIALLVALQLQRSISRPLISLTQAMETIGERHDYTVALEAATNDEIGTLVDGFNAMMGDIRDRDIRLARHREHLETEVAERTRDYRDARDAAEEANSAKSGFLATMSHEIRTPMNGILVMAELLAAGELPARSRRYAEVIARSGQSLLAIINDILDFSKIEAGKLDVEQLEVNPVEAADTVISLFHERAQSKGLDLAVRAGVDMPETIEADPVRLNQVLSNLVNNALKFTEKGHVMLTVERDPSDPTRARFSVTDTGIGIPKDKVATIFEAFSQADETTTRRFGGTGLGLSIATKLVAAMGGEIAVTSEEGRGSTFFFSLRFTAESKTVPWPAMPAAAKKPLALVCLNGGATIRVMADYLEAAGFVVRTCRPEEFERDMALARIALADIRTLQTFKRRPGPQEAAIIAVTGLGESGDEALIAAGIADAALQRPVARGDFAAILAAARDGRALADQRKRSRGAQAALPNYQGKRVLVADDSAVNREVALEALRKFHVTVDLVENGLEALRAVETTSYDLVLLDGSMPEMDGFEAARQMRARETGHDHLPIVALTAHVVGPAAQAWRTAGMDGVLHKPFTIAAMAECLLQWMGEPSGEAMLADAPAEPEQITAAPVAIADPVADATPEPPTEEEDPILDAAVIGQLLEMGKGGHTDFVARVTGLYRDHTPKSLVEIAEAHAAADLERLGAAAHALKSMSLNMGARRVAAAASELERLSRFENTLPSAEDVAAIRAKVEEACRALPQADLAA